MRRILFSPWAVVGYMLVAAIALIFINHDQPKPVPVARPVKVAPPPAPIEKQPETEFVQIVPEPPKPVAKRRWGTCDKWPDLVNCWEESR